MTAHRWLAAVTGVGLLLALAWCLCVEGSPPDAARAPAGERSAGAPADVAARATANAGAAGPNRLPAPVPMPADGVRVRVVDEAGAGVPGVDVVLAFTLAGRSDEDRVQGARTDGEGNVDLVAGRHLLAQLRQAGLPPEFLVAAEVPLASAPRAVLGARPTAPAPVVLSLPAHGRVRVRVRDAAGGPVETAGEVFLFWRAPGSSGAWERIGVPRAAVAGGEACLPVVPLGKELCLRAGGNDRLQGGEVVVPGPVRAGETVRAELRLGRPWTFITGRLVGERGAAFRGPQVSMGVGTVPEESPAALPERDALQLRWTSIGGDGRFRVRAPGTLPPGRRCVLVAEHQEPGSEETLAATALLPTGLPEADLDVGTLVLAPRARERTLVAGRVVDASGRGLAGAEVSAGYWDESAGRWVALHRQRVRSGAQGEFAIRSVAEPPEAFTVSAATAGRAPVQAEAQPGADVHLVLARAGRLHAWIEARAGVPVLLLVGAIVDPRGRTREPNQFAGRFGADDLAPGRYDVVVRIADSDWEVLRVTGVHVPEGGHAADDRLHPIDARAHCRALRIAVVDAQGLALPAARVTITDPHGRGLRARTRRDGRLLVAVPLPTPSLQLRLDDGRSAPLAAQDAEQTVVVRE